MGELELEGLHGDGEHLVLVGPGGERFRLRIDEPLRAAVRRDRPQLEQLRAESAGTLSPREIQARIRAGATTQEVADASGLPVEHVRRYEGPVLAEREYVAEQARATRVGRDAGAPTLGDLVTDRLAARGVDLASLAWDSAREPSGPWVVLARFRVGDTAHEARWTFDAARRTVVADDDEARWLSETELPDEPVARRHLAAVRDVVFDFRDDGTLAGADAAQRDPEPEPEPEPDPQQETQDLLDELRTRRGVRQSLELDVDDEEFEGFGPQHAFDFGRDDADVPGAHPVDADPLAEAVVLRRPEVEAAPEPEPRVDDESPAEPAAERPRTRKGRAKVPSWDEIVFGAKPE
ncbi:septation protein SepH [Cellulomonas fimi]|uniref:septation protein SepH n=1 Tax=Cellulomonas fimi TaxID=1708 RepID=UPI00234D56D5|nr:septation protein SepH [Cellulomonas fimi]MDC7121803.1 septation protein SepH [Cellulomonas fimi]